MRKLIFFFLSTIFLSCSNSAPAAESDEEQNAAGINVPEGFTAEIYADNLGSGRHLAVGKSGDLYARLSAPENGKTIVAMRDSNGDGRLDITKYFEEIEGGTGIKLNNNYLYFSTNSKVYRRAFNGNELVPSGERELVLSLPSQNQHAAKPLAFDADGNMFVTIGAPSNACQDPDRQAGVVGQDPCPLLESSGGIWKFKADQLNQTFADGERYATGIRHSVGITFNTRDQKLYAMQHGRDQLHQFWPEHFSEKESAELPAEEFLRVEPQSDFGWPYCYFDWKKRSKLLNPEYGGDGDSIGRCADVDYPLMGFPGHWAPNALEFYQGEQFPVSYKGGAFIAFHGSWNRAPFPQQGYRVVFVPFSGNEPISGYQNFASEFAGQSDDPSSPADAKYRPCGLAVDVAGSLYVTDSKKGRVWRISYSS
jgi:glucose/arabinose dehydrogenase